MSNVVALPIKTPATYPAHWRFCAIPSGSKGPTGKGWNLSANALAEPPQSGNLGLLHAYSGTCAIDLDNVELSRVWLAERGVDLDQLLSDPASVQILSGRENSGKLLYALPFPLPSKKITEGEITILEFRCATVDGNSVQDVLPPSVHPSGKSYTWVGSGDYNALQPLPDPLVGIWMDLLEQDRQRSVPVEGAHSASIEEITSALYAINPDCARKKWIEIGMALQSADIPFDVWDTWSQQGVKYKGQGETVKDWKSFKTDKGITVGTLFHHAIESGWQRPAPDLSGMFAPLPEADDLDEWDETPNSRDEGCGIPQPPFPEPYHGPMQELYDAAMPMSYKPQPKLMTLAILQGMSSSISGRYYFGNNVRCNLFSAGIVDTGEGKDWPRSVSMTLARAAGGMVMDMPASGEGLEDMLESYKAALMAVDEIGFMFAATNANNAQSHLIKLKREILRLFSVSNSSMQTRSKAGMPGRTLDNPCLNILGFTTPTVLGRSMQGYDIATGELPRFLVVFGDTGVIQRRVEQRFVLPDAVKKAAEKMSFALQFAQKDDDGLIHIRATDEARALMDEAMVGYSKPPEHASPFARALWTRSYEKCERIAMVLAVWSNPTVPVIEVDMVEWAIGIVDYSNWSAVEFAERHMTSAKSIGDSRDVLEKAQKILAMGKNIKTRNENERKILDKKCVPWSMLLHRSKLDPKSFGEAIDYLVQTNEVEIVMQSFRRKMTGTISNSKSIRLL